MSKTRIFAIADISASYNTQSAVYIRHYERGQVLVNPAMSAHTVNLVNTYYRVVPSGGGSVPPSGVAPGLLSFVATTSVTLQPHQAAIVLNQAP
jgi:hypothetical protein